MITAHRTDSLKDQSKITISKVEGSSQNKTDYKSLKMQFRTESQNGL